MSSPSRYRKQKTSVQRLCRKLEKLQAASASLTDAHRRLSTRAYAMQAVNAHVEALLALSMALRKQQQQLGPADQQQHHDQQHDQQQQDGAHTQTPRAASREQKSTAAAAAQHTSPAESAAPPPPPPAAAAAAADSPVPASWPQLDIGWCPERTAADAAAWAADLNAAGLRARLRRLVTTAGVLVPRIQNGAPDKEDATRELESLRSELLSFTALLAVAPPPGPQLLAHTSLFSIEEGAQGKAVPRGDKEFWGYAVSQIKLQPEQRDRVVALLELSRAHHSSALARQEELLRCCTACASDVIASEELVDEVGRVQRLRSLKDAAFIMALFGTLLTATQFAAYAVASFPFVPSPYAVMQVLLSAGEGAAAAAAAGGDDSSSGEGSAAAEAAAA